MEYRVKTIPFENDTSLDLDLLLDKIDDTPRVFGQINSYRDTVDQINDRVNQLTYSHRMHFLTTFVSSNFRLHFLRITKYLCFKQNKII
jgi:ribosomal protein S18